MLFRCQTMLDSAHAIEETKWDVAANEKSQIFLGSNKTGECTRGDDAS